MGEYEGGEDGSPIMALNAFAEHVARRQITAEVVFDFVEEDRERAEHLEHLIKRRFPTLPSNCVVDVVTGRFDDTMTKLLDEIERQRRKLAPSFFMVDPFGVSDTPMDVIRRILQNPRSEVYVSFMYEALNRFKETPEFEGPAALQRDPIREGSNAPLPRCAHHRISTWLLDPEKPWRPAQVKPRVH